MFKSYYSSPVNGCSGIIIEAYEIGNELYTRQIISINQTDDTDDDVPANIHLYLDCATVENLIEKLQEAMKAFPKKK